VTSGEVTGILYRGDAKTKYSKPNEPTINRYTAVNPYDISLISQMKNISMDVVKTMHLDKFIFAAEKKIIKRFQFWHHLRAT
jgi:hypothetical protein